jgi:hypothetical protein
MNNSGRQLLAHMTKSLEKVQVQLVRQEQKLRDIRSRFAEVKASLILMTCCHGAINLLAPCRFQPVKKLQQTMTSSLAQCMNETRKSRERQESLSKVDFFPI